MSDPLPSDLTFEQSLAELERIVRHLEDGQVGLEGALAHYEKGIGLLKRCYGLLSQAEQRIALLTGLDEDGRAITQPFEHKATSPESPRRRRKGSGAEAPAKQPEIPF
jgi:exodeoxyribonuclease VII small subunit